MAANRYTPPDAPLGEPLHPDEPRFRLRAVVLGTLVDLGSSLLLGVAVTFGVTLLLATPETAPHEIEAEVRAVLDSAPVRIGFAIGGLGLTVLGGYVAGVVARNTELRHALVTGIAVLLLGTLLFPPVDEGSRLWLTFAGLALTIPAAGLGGVLATRRRIRRTAPS